jgi:hypothetical protein
MAELTPLEIEASAIRALRGRFPRVGPWLLVKRIKTLRFGCASQAWEFAATAYRRSAYSIYGVIRRYDQRRQAKRAA